MTHITTVESLKEHRKLGITDFSTNWCLDQIEQLQSQLSATQAERGTNNKLYETQYRISLELQAELERVTEDYRNEAHARRLLQAELEKTKSALASSLVKWAETDCRAEAAERERDESREGINNLEAVIENQKCTYVDSKAYWEAENQSLREECERLKEEKALFADEMLRTLAGIVCTPVEGYNQGKFGWMLSDVRSLRKLAEQRESELAALRRALEKLAKLGNGDHYGNSIGNVIAREALGMGEK